MRYYTLNFPSKSNNPVTLDLSSPPSHTCPLRWCPCKQRATIYGILPDAVLLIASSLQSSIVTAKTLNLLWSEWQSLAVEPNSLWTLKAVKAFYSRWWASILRHMYGTHKECNNQPSTCVPGIRRYTNMCSPSRLEFRHLKQPKPPVELAAASAVDGRPPPADKACCI